MPLYEYQCGRCGRFEVIRKFSDAPLTICPTCGQEIQKLFSAPAIQFKGTGWYITDYARKSSGGDKGDKGGEKGGEKSKDGEPSKAAPSSPAAGASKDGSKVKGASTPSSTGSSSSDTSSTSTKTAKSGSGSS